MSLPAAVLWDMDGTLVDTEPYWIAAEHEIVEEHGGTWSDELAHQLVGNDLLFSAVFIKDNSAVEWEPERIVDELLARVVARVRQHMPWRPGARELLEALRERGVPSALVTMSYSVIAEMIVAQCPEGTFEVVVTGDSVTHGKPHPEPYLTAASQLGVDVTRCVAVEDSPTGLASAHAAGAQVLGVQRAVAIPAAAGRSRLDTLVGLTIGDLGRIASGEVIDRLVGGDRSTPAATGRSTRR